MTLARVQNMNIIQLRSAEKGALAAEIKAGLTDDKSVDDLIRRHVDALTEAKSRDEALKDHAALTKAAEDAMGQAQRTTADLQHVNDVLRTELEKAGVEYGQLNARIAELEAQVAGHSKQAIERKKMAEETLRAQAAEIEKIKTSAAAQVQAKIAELKAAANAKIGEAAAARDAAIEFKKELVLAKQQLAESGKQQIEKIRTDAQKQVEAIRTAAVKDRADAMEQVRQANKRSDDAGKLARIAQDKFEALDKETRDFMASERGEKRRLEMIKLHEKQIAKLKGAE